jgi:molybdate transport repressor ModE-like protein
VLDFKLTGKHRGGKAGGKTNLTPEGLELIDAYLNLKSELEDKVHDSIKAFFKKVNNISDRQ